MCVVSRSLNGVDGYDVYALGISTVALSEDMERRSLDALFRFDLVYMIDC